MKTVEEGVYYNSLRIPIIDISALIGGTEGRHAVAAEIGRAFGRVISISILNHSRLNAIIGSTFAARRAGT